MKRWLEEGVFSSLRVKVNTGVLHWMTIVQPTKNKICSVLVFIELKCDVICHTDGDTAHSETQ